MVKMFHVQGFMWIEEKDIQKPNPHQDYLDKVKQYGLSKSRDERGGLSLSLDVGKFEVFEENLAQDVVSDAEAAHVPTRERVIAKNIHTPGTRTPCHR